MSAAVGVEDRGGMLQVEPKHGRAEESLSGEHGRHKCGSAVFLELSLTSRGVFATSFLVRTALKTSTRTKLKNRASPGHPGDEALGPKAGDWGHEGCPSWLAAKKGSALHHITTKKGNPVGLAALGVVFKQLVPCLEVR